MQKWARAMAAALLLLLPFSVHSQTTLYWDNNGTGTGAGIFGDMVWNVSNPTWTSDVNGAAEPAAWTPAQIAAFSASNDALGEYTVHVDGVQSIAGLKFEDGTVTLQGDAVVNSVQLDGLLSFSRTATFDVGSALTATIDGVELYGNFGMTKMGRGTLRLIANTVSSYTGDFTLRAGTVELSTNGTSATGQGNVHLEGQGGAVGNLNPTILRLMADNQIADTAHVTISIRQYNGTLFDLNGYDETIAGLTVNGFTGTNDVGVRTGAGGVLTVNGDIFLNNNRNGTTGNNVRDVLITGTGSRGVAAPDTGYLDLGGAVRTITVATQATGTLYPDTDSTVETIIQNGGIIKEGAQMLILSGTNTYAGGTTINAGTLRIGGGATGSIMGDVVNNSILEFNRSNALSYSGNITGSGALSKIGAGTLTLLGGNSYSGATSIKNGILEVGKIGMDGIATDTNLGTQGIIYLGDTAANVGLSYVGSGESTDKVLRLIGTTGNVTVGSSGSGALEFQNAFQIMEAGARSLILTGTNTGDNTLSGGITNATDGAATTLQKTGAGTWVLEGENSYTGVTIVNGGVLRIDGAGTLATGAIRLQSGTFEVSGEEDLTLNGDPTVEITAAELSDLYGMYYSLLMGGGSAGTSATVTIDAGRTLSLKKHVGFLATNNTLGAAISGGSLDLGNELRVFVVGDSTNAVIDLSISSALTNTAAATLMKAGAGRMALTQGLNVKAVQVNNGRLDLGGAVNTITGSLQVGMNNSGSLYYGSSGGTLNVGSGSSDVLDVGVTVNIQAYSYGSSPTGVMDLRGSQQFDANVGRVRIGVHTSVSAADGVPQTASFDGVATPVNVSPSNAEVYLATNNNITALTSFVLADAASASTNGVHRLQFGEGLNNVKSPLIYFGYRKGSSVTTIREGGTLDIRGVATGATSAMYIGYSAVNTGAATTSSVNVTGGKLVADLSSLIIGWKSGGSGSTTGSSTGTLTMGNHAGNLVNVSGNVTLGTIGGGQTSAISSGSGTLSMAGGSFSVGGNVEMGTVLAGSAANANLTAAGALNLTGGTFVVQGNISKTADARSSGVITLEGGTLDLTGGTIGALGAAITFNARSGTLRSLAELNGGAALVKTTAGVLKMGGLSMYTGGTQIQAGTLEVLATSSIGTTAGGTTQVMGSDALLAGEGTIVGDTILTQGSIRPGANAGASHGRLTFDGDLILQASVGSGSTMTLGITGATGVADLTTYTIAQIPDVYDFATYDSDLNNSGNHDQIVITGEFTWGENTKLVVEGTSLSYGYGLVFNLLDWTGMISGGPTFSSTSTQGGSVNEFLSLPDLVGTGYSWDISLLTTHGVIVMVPEPGRAGLILLALACGLLRRKRACSCDPSR